MHHLEYSQISISPTFICERLFWSVQNKIFWNLKGPKVQVLGVPCLLCVDESFYIVVTKWPPFSLDSQKLHEAAALVKKDSKTASSSTTTQILNLPLLKY